MMIMTTGQQICMCKLQHANNKQAIKCIPSVREYVHIQCPIITF